MGILFKKKLILKPQKEMPGKVVKRILEEFRENEEKKLSLIDQGIINILDIPEISEY